jgi:hypothetical protein
MRRTLITRTLAIAGAAAALALASELRAGPASRRLTDRWRTVPVPARRGTRLGLSFRPRQCEDLSLDPRKTLDELLGFDYEVIRLAAYWDRIAPDENARDHGELDWQLEAAERAGKRVIVNLGAVKSFGYPEYFVPEYILDEPLPEGRLITPASHPRLLEAAVEHVSALVARYADRSSIIAWQVEHDAVDPLGMEHSWRLSKEFVEREVAAVHRADRSRPVLLNGFLPMSTAVTAHQWWRTRDQGDSVDAALGLGDAVGIDSYPRHAIAGTGRWSLYLDGAHGWLPSRRRKRVLREAVEGGRLLMCTEGQAEPWEAVTVPPDPNGRSAASCPPERVIANYAQWRLWTAQAGVPLDTYLFWGAEYWILRRDGGDPRYLDAFARVLADRTRR